MNVAAIIVTRGDQDLEPVVASLPEEWDVVIWDNAREQIDLSVYGRYAAIERTDAELIYIQDDDVIVSDPAALVEQWYESEAIIQMEHSPNPRAFVVCNMPPEFRHAFYEEHALVGFGAVFYRPLPWATWGRLTAALGDAGFPVEWAYEPSFLRTCDVAFTALNPRVLVDVPKEDLPYAHHEARMWKQAGHHAERVRMLDLVRQLA